MVLSGGGACILDMNVVSFFKLPLFIFLLIRSMKWIIIIIILIIKNVQCGVPHVRLTGVPKM